MDIPGQVRAGRGEVIMQEIACVHIFVREQHVFVAERADGQGLVLDFGRPVLRRGILRLRQAVQWIFYLFCHQLKQENHLHIG